MTATQTTPQMLPWRSGDRVQVQHHGRPRRGWTGSIHRVRGGVEYVVHTEAADGGIGKVLHVFSSSGHSPALAPVLGPR